MVREARIAQRLMLTSAALLVVSLGVAAAARGRPSAANADALNKQGIALEKRGQLKEAIACYDRAIGSNPRLAEAWCNKGAALRGLGRHEEALKCYDRALQINPRLPQAWYNKGAALYELKRYPGARQAFGKAASLGLADARRVLDKL